MPCLSAFLNKNVIVDMFILYFFWGGGAHQPRNNCKFYLKTKLSCFRMELPFLSTFTHCPKRAHSDDFAEAKFSLKKIQMSRTIENQQAMKTNYDYKLKIMWNNYSTRNVGQ